MTDIWQHHRGPAHFTFPYPAPPSRLLSLVNATWRPKALPDLLNMVISSTPTCSSSHKLRAQFPYIFFTGNE